jgi:hypothetical protein
MGSVLCAMNIKFVFEKPVNFGVDGKGISRRPFDL